MDARPLSVPGCVEFTPRQHADDRGVFLEWFKAEVFAAAVGHPLTVAQANHSVSRAGSLRGIHFAQVPPGQAKYVYCPSGAAYDVVIDVRVGSPTFGTYDAVRLDDVERRAVYVPEGVGHAFLAMTDDTVVTYLCSTGYSPGREHGINALDPEVGIEWPADVQVLLSDKDRAAPGLRAAAEQGLLASYDECLAYYELLRSGGQ